MKKKLARKFSCNLIKEPNPKDLQIFSKLPSLIQDRSQYNRNIVYPHWKLEKIKDEERKLNSKKLSWEALKGKDAFLQYEQRKEYERVLGQNIYAKSITTREIKNSQIPEIVRVQKTGKKTSRKLEKNQEKTAGAQKADFCCETLEDLSVEFGKRLAREMWEKGRIEEEDEKEEQSLIKHYQLVEPVYTPASRTTSAIVFGNKKTLYDVYISAVHKGEVKDLKGARKIVEKTLKNGVLVQESQKTKLFLLNDKKSRNLDSFDGSKNDYSDKAQDLSRGLKACKIEQTNTEEIMKGSSIDYNLSQNQSVRSLEKAVFIPAYPQFRSHSKDRLKKDAEFSHQQELVENTKNSTNDHTPSHKSSYLTPFKQENSDTPKVLSSNRRSLDSITTELPETPEKQSAQTSYKPIIKQKFKLRELAKVEIIDPDIISQEKRSKSAVLHPKTPSQKRTPPHNKNLETPDELKASTKRLLKIPETEKDSKKDTKTKSKISSPKGESAQIKQGLGYSQSKVSEFSKTQKKEKKKLKKKQTEANAASVPPEHIEYGLLTRKSIPLTSLLAMPDSPSAFKEKLSERNSLQSKQDSPSMSKEKVAERYLEEYKHAPSMRRTSSISLDTIQEITPTSRKPNLDSARKPSFSQFSALSTNPDQKQISSQSSLNNRRFSALSKAEEKKQTDTSQVRTSRGSSMDLSKNQTLLMTEKDEKDLHDVSRSSLKKFSKEKSIKSAVSMRTEGGSESPGQKLSVSKNQNIGAGKSKQKKEKMFKSVTCDNFESYSDENDELTSSELSEEAAEVSRRDHKKATLKYELTHMNKPKLPQVESESPEQKSDESVQEAYQEMNEEFDMQSLLKNKNYHINKFSFTPQVVFRFTHRLSEAQISNANDIEINEYNLDHENFNIYLNKKRFVSSTNGASSKGLKFLEIIDVDKYLPIQLYRKKMKDFEKSKIKEKTLRDRGFVVEVTQNKKPNFSISCLDPGSRKQLKLKEITDEEIIRSGGSHLVKDNTHKSERLYCRIKNLQNLELLSSEKKPAKSGLAKRLKSGIKMIEKISNNKIQSPYFFFIYNKPFKMHKYRLISKKGEGTFSEVLKAQSIKTGKYVAIKCMKNHFDNIEKVNNLREIQALRRLSPHPHIVKLLEVLYDEPTGRLALVFELMELNMYEWIRGRKTYLPEPKIKHYMYQLLKALDHMHANGIFHRDIKPENVLLAEENLKLADFGSCRGIYSKQPFTEYISTRWYRSPECLLTDGYYSYKMDIWGVGCVFFEVSALFPLFPGKNELDQINKIHNILGTPPARILDDFRSHASHMEINFPPKEGTGIEKLIMHVSEEGRDLISKMLIYDHEERITCKEALAHPYFKDISEDTSRRIPSPFGKSVAGDSAGGDKSKEDKTNKRFLPLISKNPNSKNPSYTKISMSLENKTMAAKNYATSIKNHGQYVQKNYKSYY